MSEGVMAVEAVATEKMSTGDVARIALEVARVLRESGGKKRVPGLDWIGLEEAAGMFGYSVSRFYHVYPCLGLVPSRASKRKLRFNRREVEAKLRECQRPPRGRPARHQLRTKIVGTNQGGKP